jgi:hypothetical protein
MGAERCEKKEEKKKREREREKEKGRKDGSCKTWGSD